MGSDTSWNWDKHDFYIDIPVTTWIWPGHPSWTTEARIHYLTCENGVWTKKFSTASIGYTWNGWSWEFDDPSKGPVNLPL
jgi:hypothetical protein